MTNASQRGYSLIEVVIAVVIGIAILGTAGSLLMRIQRSSEDIGSRASQNQTTEGVSQDIGAEFERVGFGLTNSQRTAFSGEVALQFLPNADYTASASQIYRSSTSGGENLRSAFLWSGIWEIEFSGSGFRLYLGRSGATDIREIEGAGSQLVIREAGEETARRSYSPSAVVKVLQDSVVLGTGANCRLRFFVSESGSDSLLYESARGCISGQTEAWGNFSQGGYISIPVLRGSEVTRRGDTNYPVEMLRLPVLGSSRFERPFLEYGGSYYLLTGADIKAGRLSGETSFGVVSSAQALNLADPGAQYAAGDVVLVSDDLSRTSCLLKIASGSGTSYQAYAVFSSTQLAGSDFEGLYSPESDFSGVRFPAGSTVRKLLPPVEMRVVSESGRTGLFRREGKGPWRLLAADLGGFAVAERYSSENYGFEISYTVGGEQTSASGIPVRQTVFPRALNPTYTVK